ncbi:MAG: hypothetical protein DMG06_11065 [Acidobacteria bacterium]|nr:MAG: hypothetical protein DMG06_11065 [Acidobacteriota bacterium]
MIGGIFRGVAHAAFGGAIEHENYSPPLEGCRGGLFRDGKDPPPKAEAFCPLPRGDFQQRILLNQTSKNCSDLHITGISSPNR